MVNRPDDWYTLGGYAEENPEQALGISRPLSRDLLPANAETFLDSLVRVHEGQEVCVRLTRTDTGEVLPGSLQCHREPGTNSENETFVRLRTPFTLPASGTPEIRVDARVLDIDCPDPEAMCFLSSTLQNRIIVKAP